MLQPGTTIAGYRLLEELGFGATGRVFLADHEQSQRRAAVRVLEVERLASRSDSATLRERFLVQGTVLAALRHPHIVQVYEAGEAVPAGEQAPVPYLAMEYVPGRTLDELLCGGSGLEPKRALALVGQIASALDAAHDAGIVHGDVRPANVIVPYDADRDHVYLIDFKMAQRQEVEPSSRKKGVTPYAAPEQLRGLPIDPRTDVYALGCVAFHLLTGSIPSQRETERQSVHAQLSFKRSVVSRSADLPTTMDKVLRKAAARLPENRYGSAGDFAVAAEATLDGGPAHELMGSMATGRAIRSRRGVGNGMKRVAGATTAALVLASIVAILVAIDDRRSGTSGGGRRGGGVGESGAQGAVVGNDSEVVPVKMFKDKLSVLLNQYPGPLLLPAVVPREWGTREVADVFSQETDYGIVFGKLREGLTGAMERRQLRNVPGEFTGRRGTDTGLAKCDSKASQKISALECGVFWARGRAINRLRTGSAGDVYFWTECGTSFGLSDQRRAQLEAIQRTIDRMRWAPNHTCQTR